MYNVVLYLCSRDRSNRSGMQARAPAFANRTERAHALTQSGRRPRKDDEVEDEEEIFVVATGYGQRRQYYWQEYNHNDISNREVEYSIKWEGQAALSRGESE